MMFGCVNNTIRLVSGKYLDLADPRPDQFELIDIAGGLSRICRFGGQCPVFYSVAEHSICCAEIAFEDGLPLEGVRAALFHDAAEAFVGDMVTPLKIMIPEYSAIEDRVMAALCERFGIDRFTWREELRRIDMSVLIAERNLLWPDDGVKWTGEDEVRKLNIVRRTVTQHIDLLRVLPSHAWQPTLAQRLFLEWATIAQVTP